MFNLFRKGKPYTGPVCWAHPDVCKDVKTAGYYAVKVGTRKGDRVRKYTRLTPDGNGGWLHG